MSQQSTNEQGEANGQRETGERAEAAEAAAEEKAACGCGGGKK